MLRLFLAIDLPAAAKAELIRIQPPPTAGVRLPVAANIHLTLHFLGDVDLTATVAVLDSFTARSFPLAIGDVGSYRSHDGGRILWVGVRHTPELFQLHETVAAAFRGISGRIERRPYSPHITLARCKRSVAAGVISNFLTQHSDFALPAFSVDSIGLYSSTLVNGPPVYKLEHSIPLAKPDGTKKREL